MLASILFAVFIVIIGVGTYYQIKTYNKTRELHTLQMENETQKNILLRLQIKEQKAKQHLYEEAIKQINEGKKDVQ